MTLNWLKSNKDDLQFLVINSFLICALFFVQKPQQKLGESGTKTYCMSIKVLVTSVDSKVEKVLTLIESPFSVQH